MKIRLVNIIVLTCFFLVSCIPSQELAHLGVINTRGVDIGDDQQYETTLVIFQFAKESNGITKIVNGKANTIKGAVLNANMETNYQLVPGKIELEIYGIEAAKTGIFPYLDTLNRDANLPDTVRLAISKTTAKEIIEVNEKSISMNIGQYLQGLIEENSRKNRFPRVSIQDFLSRFYDIGVDPILPLFELEGDKPKLAGIAIMQDDSYVGERPADEFLLFNIMKAPIKDKWLEVSIPMDPFVKYIEKDTNIRQRKDTLHTAYNILKAKSKTTLIDEETLQFETNVEIEANLFELSEKLIINKAEVIKLLEKEVEKKLTSHYEEILAQLQEQNADSFGYGIVYRINKANGKLQREEWREKFPQIQVTFNVDVNITRHGTID